MHGSYFTGLSIPLIHITNTFQFSIRLGILSPRGSSKQQKLYNRVMELTKLTFGKYHPLTCRLYINIGILHEDNQNFKKAFEYFKEWSDICENVYGKKHPKTVRAHRVLKEPRYRRMADLESGTFCSEWYGVGNNGG